MEDYTDQTWLLNTEMPRIAPSMFLPLKPKVAQYILLLQRQRRSYHPEPRSFLTSAHASHRALYRWTAQAFGLPFLVAYICDKIANRDDGGDSSWKLDLPKIEAEVLTEPLKIKTQVWGQM